MLLWHVKNYTLILYFTRCPGYACNNILSRLEDIMKRSLRFINYLIIIINDYFFVSETRSDARLANNAVTVVWRLRDSIHGLLRDILLTQGDSAHQHWAHAGDAPNWVVLGALAVAPFECVLVALGRQLRKVNSYLKIFIWVLKIRTKNKRCRCIFYSTAYLFQTCRLTLTAWF